MQVIGVMVIAFLLVFGLSGIIDIKFHDRWPNAGVIFAISLSFALLFALGLFFY